MNKATSKQFIIVGTSTDIGKTFVTCRIINEHKSSGRKIDVTKPIISGFDLNDSNCDTIKILQELDRSVDEENLDEMSAFRLKTPISPLSAAKIEGIEIKYDDVLQFCRKKIAKSVDSGIDLVIETAGGIMTPICKGKTFLDLVTDLNINVILVGACYLGGISNILSAHQNLKSKNVADITIIVNDHMDFDDKFLKIDDFMDEIRSFVDCEVFLVDNFFIYK